jgi:abortive infection bacteriophage resistance protein
MTSPQPFDKQHLEYPELVTHMRQLGLSIGDDDEALRVLSTIGYHRLGGYRYPFRRQLDPDEQRPQLHEWRNDTYIEGARFEDVVALERFDDSVRTMLLEGLFTFEIGLRNAIAHVVGRTTLVGYMDESYLDATTCAETLSVDGEEMTKLESW